VIAPPDLSKLSHARKDALILTLISQLTTAQQLIASQAASIADLEARLDELTRPPTTPGNSSKPPSQGRKQDRPPPTDRPARKSRPGVGRTLHPNPDRVVDARLAACPKCQGVFPKTAQTPQQVYERIELPPIMPDVTQVRLGGRCARCGERVAAAAPVGLEPGSPFGQSIAALVVYLHSPMPSAWNGCPP
jgi:transposase